MVWYGHRFIVFNLLLVEKMTINESDIPELNDLKVLTGVSTSTDPVVAAKELYDSIYQPDIEFCLFYCSPEYDLKILGDELKRLFADVDIIGCTSSGEITPIGYLRGSLTGLGLAGDGLNVVTKRLDDIDQFKISHGSDATRSLLNRLTSQSEGEANSANTFGYLLIDGLRGKEEVVVSSVHHGLGGIQLFGGSAADNEHFSETHLFHEGQFRTNCALLTLVQISHPFTVFKTQHFISSDKKMVVTEVDVNQRIVREINGVPAAPEYARIMGLPFEKLTMEMMSDFPVIVKIGGEYFVRSIMTANSDGSLTFACAVDEGVVMTVAHGEDMVEKLESLFEEIKNDIGKPILTLGCDCYLRRLEMDQKGLQSDIARIMMDNNVIGFSTYGEQYNASHINQTFTGVAVGSKK